MFNVHVRDVCRESSSRDYTIWSQNGRHQTKRVNLCRHCWAAHSVRWWHCQWPASSWKLAAGNGHSTSAPCSRYWPPSHGLCWLPMHQPSILASLRPNAPTSKNRWAVPCPPRRPFRRISNFWHRYRSCRWCCCTMAICGDCFSWWRLHPNSWARCCGSIWRKRAFWRVCRRWHDFWLVSCLAPSAIDCDATVPWIWRWCEKSSAFSVSLASWTTKKSEMLT